MYKNDFGILKMFKKKNKTEMWILLCKILFIIFVISICKNNKKKKIHTQIEKLKQKQLKLYLFRDTNIKYQ